MANLGIYGGLKTLSDYMNQKELEAQKQALLQAEQLYKQNAIQMAQRQDEFNREKYEEDKLYRQQELDLKKQALGIEAMYKQGRLQQLAGSGLADAPFQGKSMDAQLGNEYYRFLKSKGVDDVTARQTAFDKVMSSKVDYRVDPNTGQTISVPRRGIFGTDTQQGQVTGAQTTASPDLMDNIAAGLSGGSGFQVTPEMFEAMNSPPEPLIEKPQDLPEGMKRMAEKGTGAIPAIIDAVGSTLGQVSDVFVSPDVTAARQDLGLLKKDLQEVLKLGGRPLAFDLQQLESLLPKPGVFASPAQVKEKLKNVGNYLYEKYISDMQAANRPDLHVNERNKYKARAVGLQEMLTKFGYTSANAAPSAASAMTTQSAPSTQTAPRRLRFDAQGNIVQ
jgi:hypothetical protein